MQNPHGRESRRGSRPMESTDEKPTEPRHGTWLPEAVMTAASKISPLPARIDTLAALVAMLMLAFATIAFVSTRLFSGLWGRAGIALPVSDIYVGSLSS